MPPDTTPYQSGTPAPLPPVTTAPATTGVPVAAGPGAAAAPAADAKAQAILQARQLVVQYRTNPFQLAGALQQLKLAYIAAQYNVTPNKTDN